MKIRISYCVHCENKTLLKFLKDQYLRSVNKNKNYKQKIWWFKIRIVTFLWTKDIFSSPRKMDLNSWTSSILRYYLYIVTTPPPPTSHTHVSFRKQRGLTSPLKKKREVGPTCIVTSKVSMVNGTIKQKTLDWFVLVCLG